MPDTNTQLCHTSPAAIDAYTNLSNEQLEALDDELATIIDIAMGFGRRRSAAEKLGAIRLRAVVALSIVRGT